PLPDETAALITVQKYYTPKNRSIHRTGLQPDLVVASIKATQREAHFLNELRRAKFMDDFMKRHATFSEAALKAFEAETRKRGWELRAPVARLYLKRSYPTRGTGPDVTVDPQLQRALSELVR